MNNIIFQISAALLLAIVVNFFGKISKNIGYVNLSDIPTEGLFGFNLIFRVLAPAIYISFLSIILYFFKFDSLVRGIWMIAIWYFLFNTLVIFCIGKFSLINKKMYFGLGFLAIGISYWFYAVSLKYGLNHILPDSSDFRTEIWFIIILFFYSMLNSYEFDNKEYYKRKDVFLKKKYEVLFKHYSKFLKKDFIDNVFLEKLLFSIMIIEDINRNKFVRFIEKIFHFFGLAKTTGIMQVKSLKYLSDKESIELAQEKIQKSYEKNLNNSNTYCNLAEKIIEEYNPGYKYCDSILSALYAIDENNFFYENIDNLLTKTIPQPLPPS